MEIRKIFFQEHGDERGQLIALEESKEIPFEIKRVYYMYDTVAGVHRGLHSHRTLEQILICIHGSCKVLLDDGIDKQEVLLDKPFEGVYIGPDIWREMYDFTSDAVLLVLASQVYDENDYIRNYDLFKASVSVKEK